jgi:hypothetical protein
MSAAGTFQARSFSSRLGHQAMQSAKSSKRIGIVLVYFFSTLGQRNLVVPDSFRRPGAIEEEEVGRDRGVGRENAIRKAHDRVKVELLGQLLLDSHTNPVAKQRAIRDDDRRRGRVLAHVAAGNDKLAAGVGFAGHEELLQKPWLIETLPTPGG